MSTRGPSRRSFRPSVRRRLPAKHRRRALVEISPAGVEVRRQSFLPLGCATKLVAVHATSHADVFRNLRESRSVLRFLSNLWDEGSWLGLFDGSSDFFFCGIRKDIVREEF